MIGSVNAMLLAKVYDQDVKQYKLMQMSTYYQEAASELSDYVSQDGCSSDDKRAAKLEAVVQYYDSQKEQLETDLQLLNSDIENLKKLRDQEAQKSSFTLSK